MSALSRRYPPRTPAHPPLAVTSTAMTKGHPVSESDVLFARASISIPGGVNSPVRAFRSVGGTPRFLVSAKGAHVTDADGIDYVDLVNSWGPAILGHAHPEVVQA